MIALAAMNVPAALGSVGLITVLMVYLFVSASRDGDGEGGGEEDGG